MSEVKKILGKDYTVFAAEENNKLVILPHDYITYPVELTVSEISYLLTKAIFPYDENELPTIIEKDGFLVSPETTQTFDADTTQQDLVKNILHSLAVLKFIDAKEKSLEQELQAVEDAETEHDRLEAELITTAVEEEAVRVEAERELELKITEAVTAEAENALAAIAEIVSTFNINPADEQIIENVTFKENLIDRLRNENEKLHEDNTPTPVTPTGLLDWNNLSDDWATPTPETTPEVEPVIAPETQKKATAGWSFNQDIWDDLADFLGEELAAKKIAQQIADLGVNLRKDNDKNVRLISAYILAANKNTDFVSGLADFINVNLKN